LYKQMQHAEVNTDADEACYQVFQDTHCTIVAPEEVR
jgi:hypothetical protein